MINEACCTVEDKQNSRQMSVNDGLVNGKYVKVLKDAECSTAVAKRTINN